MKASCTAAATSFLLVLCAAVGACEGGSSVPDAGAEVAGAVDADGGAHEVAEAEVSDTTADAADVQPEVLVLPPGERTLAGKAHFFGIGAGPSIKEQYDVVGARVSLFEYPEVAMEVGIDGTFELTGLPDGVPLTLALEHDDYFPTLTRTFVLEGVDVTDVTFQSLSTLLALAGAEIVGVDAEAPGACQMATTIAAISPNQGSIWAVGEPGALAVLDPPVAAEHGPTYFNTSVIPEPGLLETTKDGGVVVAGAPPGVYAWTATKPGYAFNTITLRCEPGWITNAAPPHAVQALSEP